MSPAPKRQSPASAPEDQTSQSITHRLSSVRGILSGVLAIVGAVAVLAGLGIFLFIRELRGASYTVMALGGIMLLVSLMASFVEVRSAITGRRGRYGTNTAVMIVAFIALALLLQVVVLRNSVRWDVTATRQYTLAPQTVEILKNLKQPIKATAFFVPGDATQEQYRGGVEGLVKELSHRSSEFSYRFVDPNLQPSIAKQYDVTQFPAVILENTETHSQQLLSLPLFQERDFASALLIVTGQKRKVIYYLEGHQEKNIQDRATDSHQGFGLAASSLIQDNYQIIPYSLYADENPSIPVTGDNAVAAVIIAGPTQDLIQKEIDALNQYLARGGRLLLLLDPNPPQTYKDLLARWAVTVEDGYVQDEASNVAGQKQTPLIRRGQYNDAAPVDVITRPLDQVYFPGTSSLRPSLPAEELKNIQVYPLASTTILSCVAKSPDAGQCAPQDLNFQIPGIALMGTAPLNEKPDPEAVQLTKIVAFGDTDFATNFHLYSLSNSDLLLNSVNLLTEDITLSSVRPKPIAFRRLVVTGRELQLIRALSWFALPAAMAMLAGVAWWRRR